jgi:hypothetical protein
MQSRHQPNEFRVSVLMPGGTRTSKKYSHLGAAVKFINKVIEKWPGAKVAFDIRECQPWREFTALHIPDANRWER